MSAGKWLRAPWTKPAVFVLCLVPLLLLGWNAYRGELTANPIEYLTHETGDWTIWLLLITLSITPVRKLAGLPDLIRFRRMVGVFSFVYALLHFLIWLCLDKFFDWHEMIGDILKRRFITVGMLALLLLIPLAVTSTNGMIRRLGGRNWQRLHRATYLIAALGVIHYYWLVKSDIRKPVLYGAILTVLLGLRWVKQRTRELSAVAR